MDGDVSLVAGDVCGSHRAMQVDQNLRIGLLEFDQARGEPERPKALGHRDADLAGQDIGRRIAGAQHVECSRLHSFDGGDHHRALVSQVGAVHVAGEKGSAGLTLEIVDASADGVDRQRQTFGRRAETSGSDDFQENPGGIPIREAAEICFLAFL
ncbi:hypothetical protein ABIE87_008078 [Bradyrhizobium diazoefficiens]